MDRLAFIPTLQDRYSAPALISLPAAPWIKTAWQDMPPVIAADALARMRGGE